MKKIIIKTILIVSSFLILEGCATQKNNDVFSSASVIDDSPKLITVPASKQSYYLSYGNDPKLENAFRQYVKTGKPANIVTNGFIKYAYNPGQQPVIKVTPFQVTIISLEPGEKFTNISSGDPSRWSYSVAVSGSGDMTQQNVLVKPSPADESSMKMATNLVITTNKRIYNIRLVCSPTGLPTRSISFWYPDEMFAIANNSIEQSHDENTVSSVPNLNINNLNFNYEIFSGGFFSRTPSWTPTRVFDDGIHTYIQFPIGMSNRDMPVLFISNGSTKELVNYRSKKPYFVVDKIFKKAFLVIGSGRSETKVSIVNDNY